jgi:hypothetical protein
MMKRKISALCGGTNSGNRLQKKSRNNGSSDVEILNVPINRRMKFLLYYEENNMNCMIHAFNHLFNGDITITIDDVFNGIEELTDDMWKGFEKHLGSPAKGYNINLFHHMLQSTFQKQVVGGYWTKKIVHNYDKIVKLLIDQAWNTTCVVIKIITVKGKKGRHCICLRLIKNIIYILDNRNKEIEQLQRDSDLTNYVMLYFISNVVKKG